MLVYYARFANLVKFILVLIRDANWIYNVACRGSTNLDRLEEARGLVVKDEFARTLFCYFGWCSPHGGIDCHRQSTEYSDYGTVDGLVVWYILGLEVL